MVGVNCNQLNVIN